MSDAPPPADEDRFGQTAEAALERLSEDRRVSRSLPGGGRLQIDRRLPFLCVYRSPPDERDVGTKELLTSEASYLIAPADERFHGGVATLCQSIERALREHFGRFLRIELWPSERCAVDDDEDATLPHLQPAFTVTYRPGDEVSETVDTLVKALSRVTIAGRQAVVNVVKTDQVAPPELQPLPSETPGAAGAVLGVAVRPIYRDNETQTLFPIVLQRLRSQMATAFRKTVARFAGELSPDETPHFQTYGSRTLVKSVRRVDEQLCEVSESFDFLLQATPTNSDEAWLSFADSGYKQEPVFAYRPLPYDPIVLKRALFAIETEGVADPTLSHLFREKQVELDRQLSALRDLNTPAFRYACLQLYGDADDPLVGLAREVLDSVDIDDSETDDVELLEVDEAADGAREEIEHYHNQSPQFEASVRIDSDIPSGVMVSQGTLLISENARIRAERLGPLLHHEVGTHLLTYYNGRTQPLGLLSSGLAGYEELQEGLAVLMEHLSGGLTPKRVRVLAGRVVAVRLMSEGRPFTQTFERLYQRYGFAARTAFLMTLRVYRGGGITKDAIYLRGLRDVLEFLASDGEIDPLFAGKVALGHLRFLAELRRRGIIKPPAVLPRLWEDAETHERLRACRGRSVLELLEMNP